MLRLLVVALALAALPTASAATHEVAVLGGFFDPDRIEIDAGDSITFTSGDTTAHTVTSAWDDGTSFDVVVRGGGSTTQTFAEAGEWRVLCRPHSGMEMVVGVREAVETEAQVPGAALPLIVAALCGATLLLRTRRA